MTGLRISRVELERTAAGLSDRDLDILAGVGNHRFLTTKQITRFYFAEKPTETAALRAANRALAKLSDARLLTALERRIGGVRAGSGSFVWAMGSLGSRLLQASHSDDVPKRRREVEPSRTFLEHTLAVAEVHLRLREAARRDNVTVLGVQLEPDCWRPYTGAGGEVQRLKPDLAAITATEHFEDRWFIEVDMATEPPSRIIRKCIQYQQYMQTGMEQQAAGLFPRPSSGSRYPWLVATPSDGGCERKK